MRKFAFSLLFFISFTYCSAQNTHTATKSVGFRTTSPSGNLIIRTYDHNKIILDVHNPPGVGQLEFLNSDQKMLIGLAGSVYSADNYALLSETCFFTNGFAGSSIAAGNTSSVIWFYAGDQTDNRGLFCINQTIKLIGNKVTRGAALIDSAINSDPISGELKFALIQARRISFEDTRAASIGLTFNSMPKPLTMDVLNQFFLAFSSRMTNRHESRVVTNDGAKILYYLANNV